MDEEKKKNLPVQDVVALPIKVSIKPNENKDKNEITKEEFKDDLKKISHPIRRDDQEKKGT